MITNVVEISCCRREVAVETVVVEFFGVPRHRAGRAELVVAPGTIAEALAVISRSCPGLADLVQSGKLAPHYVLSLNGQGFLRDLDHLLAPGDRLLLLSADAGG